MRVVLVFSLFLISILSFGQPGSSGGVLAIKVFKNGKRIDLPNPNWQVIPTHIVLADSTNDYRWHYFRTDSSMYYIVPQATPAGGNVGNDFYLDIVFGKDTMTIFPPSFKHDVITLDSIPFHKGVYKIPRSVYDFKELSKKGNYYGKTPVPNLYGDWDLFTRETYKCYIEKVEDLDNVPNQSAYNDNKSSVFEEYWQSLTIEKIGITYYFYDDVIVAYSYSSGSRIIYEVKDFSDVHYFRPHWRMSVRSLFSKDGEVYAIIYKNSDNCGIFKLHFVDEKPKEDLSYLLKKQIEEEYQAELKGLRLYEQSYRDKEAPKITAKFEAVLQSLGLR